jgi:anti-sigma B factor antagonist
MQHSSFTFDLVHAERSIAYNGLIVMSASRQDILEVEMVGDVAVVNFRVRKIPDGPTVQIVGDELRRLADKQDLSKILLDFGNVEFMSSAVLGLLVVLHKKVMTAGGQISFCGLSEKLLSVFKVTGLDETFGTEPDPDEDDSGGNTGGVTARINRPNPSGGGAVSLPPPRSERED